MPTRSHSRPTLAMSPPNLFLIQYQTEYPTPSSQRLPMYSLTSCSRRITACCGLLMPYRVNRHVRYLLANRKRGGRE